MLFVGDDWAEDHHDVEVVDEAGRVLARRRLPEGLEGVTRLHALVAELMPDDWADLEPGEAASRVKVGIETDRGPWVGALTAAGYEVFGINPMSVARYRERDSTSGAKSDAADAHLLAEIVRLDRAHHRPVADDSDDGEAIKLTARTHQSLIWDRTRHVLRLRSTLREYFPVALRAFPDLDAPDALELLGRAPDPDLAARMSRATITAALRRARRRRVEDRTDELLTLLGTQELRQPAVLQDAYAAVAASEVAVIATLNIQIERLGRWWATILADTGTLRSTPACPASVCSSRPGSLVSSVTIPTGTPTLEPARTTPAPHPSLGPRAPRRSSSPATPATDDSATRSNNGRSARCADHPAPLPTTSSSAPATSATKPPSVSSPTASSASSTGASRPTLSTTSEPRGHTS